LLLRRPRLRGILYFFSPEPKDNRYLLSFYHAPLHSYLISDSLAMLCREHYPRTRVIGAPTLKILRDIALPFHPKLKVIAFCFNLSPIHSVLTCDSRAMLHMKHFTSAEQSTCCSDALGSERNVFINTTNCPTTCFPCACLFRGARLRDESRRKCFFYVACNHLMVMIS